VNAAVNLVTPPICAEADVGMIVIESDFYPPMSGSNLMCTVTAVLETGMLPMTEPITRLNVDTPAGLVRVEAECRGGKCRRVSFSNVPSFVMALMHARGEIAVAEVFKHLLILDTEFTCSIEATTKVVDVAAVTTNVAGRAWLTGVSYYGCDPEDPFPQGYRLNDTWLSC
jgi:proline racemase